jgi:hypothetical protein
MIFRCAKNGDQNHKDWGISHGRTIATSDFSNETRPRSQVLIRKNRDLYGFVDFDIRIAVI